MKFMFKDIGIYIDKNKKLIGVPRTNDKKWNATVDIDPIITLEFPYTNKEVNYFLNEVFSLCHNQIVEDCTDKKIVAPIQKYMKVRSWKAAVKGLGLINLNWIKNEGYTISITWQNSKEKNSFDGLSWEYDIKVPDNYKNYELADAFLNVLDKVAIGPQEKNPYV